MTSPSLAASSPKAYRPSTAMRILIALGDNLTVGRLSVTLPDGTVRRFGGTAPGPQASLIIHRDRVARRFLTGGNLGFCEAYLDGDWSSPDVEALFVFFLKNEAELGARMEGRGWFRLLRRLGHLARPNSRRGARRNIMRHYDLGNAFYERWLDPSMTYSAAVFREGAGDLSAAQRAKYAAMARRIGLQPGHHVLEVGCGWGGFAEFAAGEVGARVTGITISEAQAAYARERIRRAGLSDRVDIRLEDYRDTRGLFDRIVSIEMFEAVGEAYWPAFFRTLRERLASGGSAALQIITIEDARFETYRRSADYIQKYIFPGGMLPSIGALRGQLNRAGLQLRDMASYGSDYARTLREWNRRFQAAWPDIQGLGFDGRFKRLWEQYLYYCAAGFTVGTIDVVQLAVSRD